jgi:hypothetical protein
LDDKPTPLLKVKHYAKHINRYAAVTNWMTRKITIYIKGRQKIETWSISVF